MTEYNIRGVDISIDEYIVTVLINIHKQQGKRETHYVLKCFKLPFVTE